MGSDIEVNSCQKSYVDSGGKSMILKFYGRYQQHRSWNKKRNSRYQTAKSLLRLHSDVSKDT